MAEIVVVGASVAGAATAIHLSRAGHSVHLIDQAQQARAKACGEGVFSTGVAELDRLGLLPALLPQAAVLTAVEFEAGGHIVAAPLGAGSRPAIGLRRSVLDTALLDLARSSGVDVSTGVRALGLIPRPGGYDGVVSSQGEIRAKVVVAADGAGSRLRREAGLDVRSRRRRFGMSAHFEVQSPPSHRVQVHFRPGYEVYVTPVGETLLNVAVLVGAGMARLLGGRLPDAYLDLVTRAGALPLEAVMVDGPLAAGPFPVRAKRAQRDNLVLVGDAAGFFDGVTGEGISLALASARLCAGSVHLYLMGEGEAVLAAYDRQRRDLARNSTLMGRLVLALASRPRLAGRAVANLARRPETFAKLVSINTGERPLASLRPRDLLALVFGL